MTTNPNTPEFETVDDFIEAYENTCDSVPCAVEGHQDCRQRAKDSFKQSMRVMMEEVIGDSEAHVSHLCPAGNIDCVVYHTRQDMRNQQRQRLDQASTKYFGEG